MGGKRYIEITPSNQVATGKISYRNGNNIVSFTIGASEMMLIPSSVRLCGKIGFFKSDGVRATAGDKLMIDQRTGVYGMLSQLIVRNGQQQVMEHLKHYNRFMSSFVACASSLTDQMSFNSIRSNTIPNYELLRTGLVENGVDTSFCVPLTSGVLMNSTPLPMSSQYGLNGMVIDCVLNSDADFLYEDGGDGSGISDAYYQLSDVKLVAEVLDPTPEEQQEVISKGQQDIQFTSFSTYYTSINSQNAIINFSLSLKQCISAHMNFIPSKYINNRGYNGCATLPPLNSDGKVAPVKSVLFTRGGQAFPTNYQIDTLAKDQSPLKTMNLDPQVTESWINAVRDWDKRNQRLLINNKTANYNLTTDGDETIEGGQNFGIGQQFTLYDTGVDFSQQTFGINMQLGLTTDSPNSVFLFVKHRQTCLFDENGLQIV